MRATRLPGFRRSWFCATASVLLTVAAHADGTWPRPTIIPLPASVTGVSEPVPLLSGDDWKFTLTPPADFWLNSVDPASWADVTVPGEAWMQGQYISLDTEYPWKKSIDIPAEFAGQRIFIRFDGVYSYGRVWVNGTYLGDHDGGFNSWQLEVTDHVTPGQAAWLTVGVTDRTHDPSFASRYAGRYLGKDTPRRIGGILRDVTLFAMPATHLTRLHAGTDLDASYQDATLSIESAVDFGVGTTSATINYVLTDPSGTLVAMTPSSATLTSGTPESTIAVPVTNPLKWDAEHPHLYTLEARLFVGGTQVQVTSRRIGFREIEIVDDVGMLVNGSEVKLRGGNRHSAHPLTGRADLAGLDEADVLLYKDANINYVRTSHYPCNSRFLELCDEYGIYVEEEAAICWATDHKDANGVNLEIYDDPAYRPYFMNAIAEPIERDFSHPSLIMWSIGNEDYDFGTNFQDELDYGQAADPTRPFTCGDNNVSNWKRHHGPLDINSEHYPAWNANYNHTGTPYIYDEYCHVRSYYNKGEIPDLDPNVRSYWGESLKAFWDNIFPSNGTIGAAIWGTIDDTFLTPAGPGGYGRWGIFDGWRREKPEHWVTKKGYSPIRIANAPLGNPGSGSTLDIPVSNWFDHTDFSELEIFWQVGDESGTLTASLAPHADGTLTLPARAWQDDDHVYLAFTVHQPGGFSYVADEFLLPLTARTVSFPAAQGPAPSLVETTGEITVTGSNFELIFDKSTGAISSGTYGGRLVLTGGPDLNLTPYNTGIFALTSISAHTASPNVIVTIAGDYGSIGVTYVLSIDGTGLIETTYTVTNPPANSDSYAEVGLRFRLPETIDRLEWDRNGFYSAYPSDHIARNQGGAGRYRPGSEQAYRDEPTWPWFFDMKDFHQHGATHAGYGMTHDFRSLKEDIYSATAMSNATGTQIRVESDGATHGVRIGLPSSVLPVDTVDDRDPSLVYSGAWSPYNDGGDYNGTETFSNQAGDYVEYNFTGTSAQFISARNTNLGIVDIYLDGVLVDTVDAYATSKQHQEVLYSVSGLPDAPHTLKVVVTGTNNPAASDSHALIDAFSPLPDGPGLYLHVNRHWAYKINWGSLDRTSSISSGFSDTVSMRLLGGTPRSGTDLAGEIFISPAEIVHLNWHSDPLAFYDIEYSPDLDQWFTWVSFLPATGESTALTIDLVEMLGPDPETGFFRIREHR